MNTADGRCVADHEPATFGGINAELVPSADKARTDDAVDDGGGLDRGPGRGVRLFVGGFLGLFLLSGLAGVEAWPLTGWKMYAKVRHGERWGWQVLAVRSDGSERSVDLRRMGAAYHGVTHFLSEFEGLPATEREAACLALAGAALAQHTDVAAVVVDHVLGRVPVDPDGPPTPATERIRVHECQLD